LENEEEITTSHFFILGNHFNVHTECDVGIENVIVNEAQIMYPYKSKAIHIHAWTDREGSRR
jgi:hypothetical protein